MYRSVCCIDAGVRVLDLPPTLLGVLLLTTIQTVGVFAIVNFCLMALPKRLFLVGFALVFLGNVVWPAYHHDLSNAGQGLAELIAALALGMGLGGTVVPRWTECRRDSQKIR